MTTQTDITPARPARAFFAGFGTAVRAMFASIAQLGQAVACQREAERLFALSDAELARQGLTRDAVIPHVFRRYLYI